MMRLMRLTRLDSCGLSEERVRTVMVCGVLFASFSIRALCATVTSVHGATQNPPGLAWNVKGSWHVEGSREAILAGDSIQPGSLLEPGAADSDDRITILLPDGQQILDQCSTAKDCARGFRVPELESDPSPFSLQLIVRIRAALLQQRVNPQLILATHSDAGRDEAAAILEADNRISISGLAASLSNGSYVYDLNPIQSAYPPQTGVSLQKSGRSIAFKVPGPGLYRLRIVDSLGNPRIDDVIAAVRPGEGDEIVNDFHKAHALFRSWIEDFQGWPIHDFQRAYLEALMLDMRPAANSMRIRRVSVRLESGVTADPVFSPKPGMSNGNLDITLRSATQGAAIHYTIDGAQPLESSPVYRAPIVMKRVPIRIKAFAESPGKKDSAVVTGFFAIANP